MTTAFAPERAQRQLLVDHHLRQVRSGSYSGVAVLTGERMLTGERVTPVVTHSGMSRTVVMPPPPPPPRARVRAQARATSLRRTLWSIALGVAAAAPLAVLVVLLIGQTRTPSDVTAPAPAPAVARVEVARPSQALTNEPIEVARFNTRVVPIEPVVITPNVVELRPSPPPRPRPQALPAAVRSHRRVVAASESSEQAAKPTSPPPVSSQRSRSFTDATSAPREPRPIDVVNPFMVPRTAAVTGAPAR